MRAGPTTKTNLTGRTVLIAPSVTPELATELERYGARVITWPQTEMSGPDNYVALDEAIENLFGYDWIIFNTVHSVDYFLHRFQELNHEISELDSLRVCAISEAISLQLEESQVHVDVIPDKIKTEAILTALENHLGEHDSFRGLNFLIPRSAIARDFLSQALEDAGARADIVAAYRTVARNNPALVQLNALFAGGGIDCIAFTSSSGVADFAELLDTNDLAQLLPDVTVACINETVAQKAADFGLCAHIVQKEPTISKLAAAIAECFGSMSR